MFLLKEKKITPSSKRAYDIVILVKKKQNFFINAITKKRVQGVTTNVVNTFPKYYYPESL